jgi:hypothetical protein
MEYSKAVAIKHAENLISDDNSYSQFCHPFSELLQ